MSSSYEQGWTVPEELEKIEGVAYLPTYFTEETTRLIHKMYGDARFYYVTHPDEGHVGTAYLINDNTPYDHAMRTLSDHVLSGKLSPDHHEEAVKALMRGDFDWSPASEYLPTSSQE